MKSLVAAIQYGADAVYLGGSLFSARANAKNFTSDQLEDALYYAHLRGVNIHVTVNTILNDKELKEALDYLGFLDHIGVDGLIIQDLGLIDLSLKHYPSLRLHGSTQMTINSLEGAKILEDMGLKRVVLARETPLDEIRKIKDHTSLEVEVFAHGALCVSYSGQCLMSSMIGSRSGNRGRCAQPCRKSYELIRPDKNPLDSDRAYYISPKDLNTSQDLDKLIEAGIDSIKIEGRMKRPDYVAQITKSYRQALESKTPDQRQIEQAFNRGFTIGLNMGDFAGDFVNIDRQNNQGISCGHVISQVRQNTKIYLDEDLNKGDLLEFEEIESGARTFLAPRDLKSGHQEIAIPFDVKINSKIRRIINQKTLDQIQERLKEDRLKKGLDLKFVGKIDHHPKLVGSAGNIQVTVQEVGPVQEARKTALTKDQITDHLDRLGTSDFYLKSLDIDIDDNIFIPISQINKLRQEMVEEIEQKIKDSYKRKNDRVSYKPQVVQKTNNDLGLSIGLASKSQLKNIDLDGIDNIYLGFIDRDIYEDLKTQDKKIYYRPLNILHHKDYVKIKDQLEDLTYDGIVIDNLGGFEGFKSEKIIGSTGLNIFNSQAANLSMRLGAEKIIASPELSLDQIIEISSRTEQNIETIAYGFVRVMTMGHCPFSTIKGCTQESRDCKRCKFSKGHYLRDEKNIDFPALRIGDYSYLYNSYPISMAEKLTDFKNIGLSSILLDFTIEKDPSPIIEAYKDALAGKETNINNILKDTYGNINYGHYYRGID